MATTKWIMDQKEFISEKETLERIITGFQRDLDTLIQEYLKERRDSFKLDKVDIVLVKLNNIKNLFVINLRCRCYKNHLIFLLRRNYQQNFGYFPIFSLKINCVWYLAL